MWSCQPGSVQLLRCTTRNYTPPPPRRMSFTKKEDQVCPELHHYVHQLHFTLQTHSILMNVSFFLIVSKPLNFGVSIFYLFKQKLNKTLKDFYCYKYCGVIVARRLKLNVRGFIVARRLKLNVRIRFYLKQFQALH